LSESLRESVEKQASAHVRGDEAAFASYMTPQALLQLRGNGHVRLRKYSLISHNERGATGESVVRYAGSGSYVLRQRWERRESGWTTVDADRPAAERRLPWWRRIFVRPGANGTS
jgi:hypothetical protein